MSTGEFLNADTNPKKGQRISFYGLLSSFGFIVAMQYLAAQYTSLTSACEWLPVLVAPIKLFRGTVIDESSFHACFFFSPAWQGRARNDISAIYYLPYRYPGIHRIGTRRRSSFSSFITIYKTWPMPRHVREPRHWMVQLMH